MTSGMIAGAVFCGIFGLIELVVLVNTVIAMSDMEDGAIFWLLLANIVFASLTVCLGLYAGGVI